MEKENRSSQGESHTSRLRRGCYSKSNKKPLISVTQEKGISLELCKCHPKHQAGLLRPVLLPFHQHSTGRSFWVWGREPQSPSLSSGAAEAHTCCNLKHPYHWHLPVRTSHPCCCPAELPIPKVSLCGSQVLPKAGCTRRQLSISLCKRGKRVWWGETLGFIANGLAITWACKNEERLAALPQKVVKPYTFLQRGIGKITSSVVNHWIICTKIQHKI